MAVSASTPPVAATRRGAPPRTQLMVVVNPRASRFSPDELAAAVDVLRDAFAVTTASTEARGHAVELARDAAAAGIPLVAAAGGDGTFNEAANALAGSGTAMACLPTGVTNVFSRSLGVPRRPVEAARRLVALAHAGRLEARPVDLGTVNGRHFACTSGVGFSASMTAAADAVPERKARLGQLQFAGVAASELARRYLRDPPRMSVHAAGRRADAVTVVVQNSRALTYFGSREIQACEAAGLDTGAISLTLIRRARPRDLPPVLLRLVAGRVADHPEVEGFAGVDAATVESADGRPLPLEVDGEYLGEHHRIEYGVAPGALKVVG